MPNQLPCPNPACSHVFSLAEVQRASSLSCPRCGQVFLLRAASAAPAAQPPAASVPPAKPKPVAAQAATPKQPVPVAKPVAPPLKPTPQQPAATPRGQANVPVAKPVPPLQPISAPK